MPKARLSYDAMLSAGISIAPPQLAVLGAIGFHRAARDAQTSWITLNELDRMIESRRIESDGSDLR